MDKQKEKFSENIVSRAGDEEGLISLAEASKNSRYSQAYLSLRARKRKLKAVRHNNVWHTTREWLREYEEKHGGNGSNGNKFADLEHGDLSNPVSTEGDDSAKEDTKHSQRERHLGRSIPAGVFIFLVAFILFSTILFAAPPLASELALPQSVENVIESIETWRSDTTDFVVGPLLSVLLLVDDQPVEQDYAPVILPSEQPREDDDALSALWAVVSGFEERLSNLAKRITGRTIERELVTEVTEILPIERITERVEIVVEEREIERITEVINSADLDLLMSSIDSKYSTSGGVLTGNLTFPIGSAFTIGTPTGGAPSSLYVDDIIRVGAGTLTLTSSGISFGSASIGLGADESTKGAPGIIYDEEKGTWFLRGNDEYFSQITTRAIDRTGGGGGGSDSDWLASGSDIYSGVAGNVGIGLTNPSTLLQVDGLLTVGDSSSTNGALVFENATNAFGVTVHAQNQTVGSVTFAFPDTFGAGDTICLLALGNCGGVAGNTLQQAYVAGNTILATNAEGDIDLTVAEATNFSVDITGTGSFLVQDGGVNVFQVADGGKTTFQPTTNQVDAFTVQDSIGTKLISVNTSTNQLILGDTATSRYLAVTTTGGGSGIAVNATSNGGGIGSGNALFFVQQRTTSSNAVVIKASGTGLANTLINTRTSDNQTIVSIGGSTASLLAKAISGQAVPLFLTLDSSSNNLISIDSTGNLNLLKEATATSGTQYSSQDLVLQGSVWDTTLAAAVDRQISLRTVAGSGATGLEPYRLDILDNAGTEFVSFDGLNQRVGIGTSTPTQALDVTGNIKLTGNIEMQGAGQNINFYRANIFSPTTGGGSLVVARDGTCAGSYSCGVVLRSTTTTQLLVDRNDFVTISTSSTERFRVSSNGNVGISTTTPQEKLTLGPSSNFATEMALPGAPTATPSVNGGSIATGTYYYVITASDGVGETLKGTESSATAVTGPTGSVALSWTAIQGASSYSVYRTTTSGTYSTPALIGTSTTASLTDTLLTPSAGAPPASTNSYVNKFAASGDSWLLGGNVGIGTSTPTQALQVDGQIYIDVGAPGSNTNYFVVGNNWPTQLNFGLGAGTNSDPDNPNTFLKFGNSEIKEVAMMGLFLKSGGSSIFAEDHFVAYTDNSYDLGATGRRWRNMILSGTATIAGNVGIGTTTPITKLDLSGSARLIGSSTSILTGSIDPIASTTVTGAGTAFDAELVIGDRITVTGETRTVTAITSATLLTVDTAFTDNLNDTSPDRLAAQLTVRDSAGNLDFVINDAGNVGIGTDAPSSKLTLADTGNAGLELFGDTDNDVGEVGTGYILFSQDDAGVQSILGTIQSAGADSKGVAYTGTLTNATLLGTLNNMALQFGTNDNVRMTIEPGGDIGIGTTEPARELHIGDGIIRVDRSTDSAAFMLHRTGLKTFFFGVSATGVNDGEFFISDLGSAVTGGGTKRLLIDNSGLLGIGTSTPTALLNLKGNLSSTLTGTVAVTNLSTAVVGTTTLFTTELAVGDSIKIGTETFTVSVITDAFNLTLDSAYQGSTASGLTAYRDPTLLAIDNGDAVNKLIVTSSGNVGIGTAAPVAGRKLTVSDEGIKIGGIGGGGSFGYLELYRNVNDFDIMGRPNRTLNIGEGANAYIEIQGATGYTTFEYGNVGIGTTGPDRKLDVLDASNPQLRLTQADGTVYTDFQMTSSGDLIMNVDGVTNQLVLDNGGNVGIGTTTPGSGLHIKQRGQSSSYGLRIENSGGSTSAINLYYGSSGKMYLDFFNNDTWYVGHSTLGTGNAGYLQAGRTLVLKTFDNSAGSIVFDMDGTEIARFNASGDLGIGTTTPQEKLTLGPSSNFATEMALPGAPTATPSVNGGSIATGTYYYVITASDGVGETLKGTESSATSVIGPTGSVALSWTAIQGASSYTVYRTTVSGTYSTPALIGTSTTASLTDTLLTPSAGAPPSSTNSYVNKFASSGDSWLLGGNVGIGKTANRNYTLNVQDSIRVGEKKAGLGYLTLKRSSIGSGTNDVDIEVRSDRDLYISELGNPNPFIHIDGDNDFTTFEAGLVGIGTTSPTALLNIKGNLSSALTGTVAVTNLSAAVVGTSTLFTTELAVGDSIKIGTETFTVSVITDAFNLTLDTAYQGSTASGLTAYRDPTLFVIDNGDSVNKLTVTSSGNVGIGTATPTELLTVGALGGATAFSVSDTGVLRGDYNGSLFIDSGYNSPYLRIGNSSLNRYVQIYYSIVDPVYGSPNALRFTASATGYPFSFEGGGFGIVNQSASREALIVRGATSQTADIFAAQNDTGLTLVSIDSNFNLNLLKEGTATVGTQYSSQDLVLQGSAWDSTLASAVDRQISFRTVAGSGATGLEPYRLDILDNAGTEFVSFDGLNQRVGIGTATPSYPLHVNGAIGVDGSIGEGVQFTTDGVTSADITLTTRGGSTFLYLRNAADSDYKDMAVGMLYARNSASVGGDSSPDAMLEVAKNGANDLLMLSSSVSGDGDFLIVDSSGNVGIATTSPTALLNIKGNLSSALTGTVAVTNLSAAVVGTSTLFTTELAVGDSIKIGTETFTVSVITDAFNLTLDTAYQGSTASGLTAYRDPTLLAIDNGDAVNKLIVTSSGNVGIGTATPDQSFTLSSTSMLGWDDGAGVSDVRIGRTGVNTIEITRPTVDPGQLTVEMFGNTTAATSIDSMLRLKASLGDNLEIYTRRASAPRIVSTGSDLQIYASNASYSILLGTDGSSNLNKVGIGNATPDAKLDVESTGAVTTTNYAQQINNLVTNVTTDAINKYGLYISSTGSFTGSAGTATNNYGLYVDTPTGGDNNYAAIFEGGNVGIGTVTPAVALQVVAANGEASIINSGSITAAGEILELKGTLGRTSTSSTYGSALYITNSITPSSGASNLSFVDIKGTINQTGFATGITRGIYVRPTLTSAIDFRAIDIASTGFGIYQSSSNATNYFNGNVGIATTSPITTLDVNGSTRLNGSATSVLTGSIDPIASITVTGVGTAFDAELVIGDRITVTGEARTVTAIASATSLTVDTAFSDNLNDTSPDRLAAQLTVLDSSSNLDFVINDQGNVGIGTATPHYQLEIGSNAGGQIDLRNLDSNSGGVQVGTVLGSLNFSGTDFAPDTDARTAAAIRGLGDRSWTGTASTHDAALAFFTQYDSSVGLVEQMRISSLGLVGIGTTPTETLTVADDFVGYAGSFFNDGNLDTRQGVFIQACLDVDPTTSCNFLELRDGDGTILGAIEGNGAGGVTNASAGGDYAELFPGNISDFEGGDLVALDSDGSVVLAMNTLPLLGAYSTNSNTLGNWRDGWKESGEWVPVGLLGQMMVNVTTENGDISVGDSITISSTAGVGMKAAQPGKVVGVALESFGLSQDSTSGEVVDGSYGIEVTGSIMVLVDPTWYIPNGAPSGGQLALSGVGLDGSQTDFIRGIKASIVDVFLTTGTYIRNGIVAFRELFVDKLFVNEFTVEGGDMRISDSDPTISSFVVEEGASEVTIENRNVRPQSQIYITFRGAPADIGGWSIVERVEGVSFTFAIAKPAPNDIDVDYWIVQTRKLDDSDSVIGEERSEEESPDVPRDVTDGLIGEFEPPLAEDMGVDLTSGVDENGLLSDTNSSSENNSGKGLIEGDSQSNSNGEGDGNDSLQDGSGSSVE